MNEPRQVSIRSVFTQCFTHVRRAPGQCAKPYPGKVSAAFTQRLHAPGVCERSVGASCVPMVRSQVRTIGTRPPMRTSTKFALLVRPLLRDAGANLAGGYQHWLPERMAARREVSTVVSTLLQCFFTGRALVCETTPWMRQVNHNSRNNQYNPPHNSMLASVRPQPIPGN